MADNIIISEHTRQRVRERVKIPLRAVKTFVKKSIHKGKVWPSLRGQTQQYVKSKIDYDNGIDSVVLYKDWIFLWSHNMLVTVLDVPGAFPKHERQ